MFGIWDLQNRSCGVTEFECFGNKNNNIFLSIHVINSDALFWEVFLLCLRPAFLGMICRYSWSSLQREKFNQFLFNPCMMF